MVAEREATAHGLRGSLHPYKARLDIKSCCAAGASLDRRFACWRLPGRDVVARSLLSDTA